MFADLPRALTARDRLVFSRDNSGTQYLANGWATSEDWGTWSEGKDAALFLPLESEEVASILVEARTLVSPFHPKQTVEVRINGIPTESLTLTANSAEQFTIKIPPELRQQRKLQNRLLKIQLYFPDAVSPGDLGMSGDGRMLALGLIALTVQ